MSLPNSMKLDARHEQLAYWQTNPTQFVIEAIGATPDDWQADVLQALAEHDKISVRSCHGPGKSTLDSWAIIWFMSCFFPAKVPCSAPTLHQLKDILWSELAIWHKQMLPELRDQFVLKASDQDMRFYMKAAPQQSFAVARTGRKDNPEALQGFHSENLLFILDEASGIDEIVFEVAQGALSTPHAKVLMTSNPTRTSGYFHRSHHGMRDRWSTFKIAAADSPRVSKTYSKDVGDAYGYDSNVYKVRVLGEFPSADDDTVIPLELCESAIARDVEPSGDKIIWGLDVARFGDDRTALAKRKGNTQLEPVRTWQGKDLMQTAGIVALEYEEAEDKPDVIMVDAIGLGAGVADRLKEQGLPAKAVNVAESPSVKSKYQRLRDELWFLGREWLVGLDVKLADDDALVAELTVPRYQIGSNGKFKVEGKDEMKKRGIRSPDCADSWLLTFATSDRRGKKVKLPGHTRHMRQPSAGGWMG